MESLQVVENTIKALNNLYEKYGKDKVDKLYDELNKEIGFVDLTYGVMITGGRLAAENNEEFKPRLKLSERYSSIKIK